ncbi:uncharacterized protein F4822DRAFT_84071 [Hypoxylon trugodes]|uniref:uncharacterized protein n=1 Tax=Hypoxylon trugodes TaxID=326681 RepID=UPI00219245E6|nr:uncharacterized protein F4822DRAFT_84071 [Hypoxylon trugodes]KAI1383657.1 hypothetical protein F4822DRAFT_84071 [Hypoxylon trugodes]
MLACMWKSLRSIPLFLLTFLISSIPPASALPVNTTNIQDEWLDVHSLALKISWCAFLLIVLSMYAIYTYLYIDKWSFLGIGMGVPAWTYSLIISVSGVPPGLIISDGAVCTIFTFMWAPEDFRMSRMGHSHQQIAKSCIVISAMLIDTVISSVLAYTDNFLLGLETPLPPGLMMAILAIPSVALSAVLCKAVRVLGISLAEPSMEHIRLLKVPPTNPEETHED